MEGSKFMGGEMPHQEHEGSVAKELAREVTRAEEAQEEVDALGHSAEAMLARIHDPERRAALEERLKALHDKKDRLPRAHDIAERMIERHGEEYFEKNEKPGADLPN